MANELQTKLDAILLDKNTNLLPENLKKGVTVLGINGTLEASGGSDTLVGRSIYTDIGLSFRINYGGSDNTIPYNTRLIWNVPYNIDENYKYLGVIAELDNNFERFVMLYPSNTSLPLYWGAIAPDQTGKDGVLTLRIENLPEGFKVYKYSNIASMENIVDGTGYNDGPVECQLTDLSSYSTYDYKPNDNLTIKMGAISANSSGKRVYFATNDSSLQYNTGMGLSTLPMTGLDGSYIVAGKKVIGPDGQYINGTLDTASIDFMKLNAYTTTRNWSWNGTDGYEVELSATTRYALIPTNFTSAQKYFVMYETYMSEPGREEENHEYWVYTSDTPIEITTSEHRDYDITNNGNPCKKWHGYGKNYLWTSVKNLANINALQNFNEPEDLESLTGFAQGDGNMQTLVIYTNCGIKMSDGSYYVQPLQNPGNVVSGNKYVGPDGVISTGTYEPDYTELGTISPTEYDTAVTTSEDILGTTTE